MVNDKKAPSPKFWFYHEWTDEAGRFWAEPRNFQFVSDARREHAMASKFRWQTAKMFRASLSCLYARDAIGTVILEPQQRPAGWSLEQVPSGGHGSDPDGPSTLPF